MKSKSRLFYALLVMVFAGAFIACQPQTKKELAVERAEQRLEDLEDKLDSISDQDPEFVQKLDNELDEFERSLDNLSTEMENEKDEAGDNAKQAFIDLKAETRELRYKIAAWGEDTGDSIDSLAGEIKESFRDLKRNIRDKNDEFKKNRDKNRDGN